PAPTEISPLSLHDALPISKLLQRRHGFPAKSAQRHPGLPAYRQVGILQGFHGAFNRVKVKYRNLVGHSAGCNAVNATLTPVTRRSEEHTSELQSRENLVCR